jgi:hypothetical protein
MSTKSYRLQWILVNINNVSLPVALVYLSMTWALVQLTAYLQSVEHLQGKYPLALVRRFLPKSQPEGAEWSGSSSSRSSTSSATSVEAAGW